ncbi:uncharacterized protein ATC70_003037 [Mucor velutinosus]|uniref:Polar growth protein n=1 Tax=Mucor velutinosus TaxID=708070 RepID=A0AAN7D9C8_9FUNG|nr:hypothetical protein ATC70_003037 [Mucor velutinosus]
MPGQDIVYTVHKFEAENVDEISINVGEQVIVIEKDEGFNDGWWQGRNVRGEIGLFPISYTVKHPPTLAASSLALENKIDLLENAISKMKAPTSASAASQPKKTISSMSSMSSISSKNIHSAVHQSLENPLLSSKVEEWTSDQVSTWLISVGFDKQLADNFKDQEITGDILLELTLDSLKELDVTTFGKRFKIHNAINALRQETRKQKQHTSPADNSVSSKNIEARVASPFPDLGNHRSNNNALSSYYNSNKQQQPYPDDDLVSDYSTVIRNSQLAPPKTTVQKSSMPPPRPTIPLDMDLIASSPRLSNLVERQNVEHSKTNNMDRQEQQLQLQIQQNQSGLLQQQQQQQRIQYLQQQRPTSHQVISTPTQNNQAASYWKRSTMNNIKTQESIPEGRSSTSSRYSFMRSSLMPSGNKLQNILPTNAPSVRRSEDVSLSEVTAAPDMEGWLYKQGDKYKTWNKRWFVLKANNLFYFKSPKAVRMKGIINLKGYRIEVDESIQPGKYCFMAHHERERTFYFYTESEKPMKDWLKALMKATIARDFATPVMSSSTIPTISLEMARRMRPRPPSTIFLSQNDPMRASSPAPYRNNMNQHFSLMSLDERAQPIMQFSHQQDMSVNGGSRAPSVMSTRPMDQQKRMLPDNASDYSIDQRSRLKDSGFNSTHGGTALTRSATESSRSSSGRQSISMASVQQQSTNDTATVNNIAFYLDEEDEDLIDPEHMSVIESNRPTATTAYRDSPDRFSQVTAVLDTRPTKQDAYVDWVNAHIQGNINNLTDLSSGEVLLEFLEALTSKEILKPVVMPGQTLNAQRMDRVIAAFKFMSLEGVDMDGSCTIRDVLNGNDIKIMHMLDAVEYWSKSQTNETNGKKMASGGTFGEDDQCKLRELEEESENILPPNSFASR